MEPLAVLSGTCSNKGAFKTMSDEHDTYRHPAPVTKDIGWKQFSVGIFDLVRWPLAIIIIVAIMRAPLTAVFDALAASLRS